MSIVASYFSSASSTSGHARFASTMDSIFAIGLGLTLRLVVDVVSHHDLRLGGTLVGLWEGVVMLHFLKKMPSSFDPYVAYGVRLFVDFLFTENIARMVVVLLWTGMGMVLADVMPVLWYDTGLQGVWNRILRDLFLLPLSLPALPSFGKNSIASRVRFGEMPSLSRASSLFTTVRSAPSIASTSPPSPTVFESPALQIQNSRGVPGSFPDWSETETELGSALDHPPHHPSETADDPGAAHGILPEANPLDESATEASTEQIDLDAGNISSSAWSSASDTTDPSASNPSEIPDLEEGLEEEKGEHSDRDHTPKQIPIVLPPTPADSAREVEDGDHTAHDEIQPPLGEVPTIPDHIESEIGEGWETVEMDEALPPPPPSKDDLDIPPPTGDAGVPPPSEGAADADAASSAEKPTAPSEQTVVPPPTTDNAPPPPAADEKAPSAPARDTRTPPPSFEDVYAEDHPDDKPSTPPPNAEPVNNPDKELPDPPIPSPPSPTTTNHESIHSLPSSSRLEQALALRKSAAALEKQLKQIEAERKDAVKEGNTALAIVKKVELEKVANEAKLHHKRAERRIFPGVYFRLLLIRVNLVLNVLRRFGSLQSVDTVRQDRSERPQTGGSRSKDRRDVGTTLTK